MFKEIESLMGEETLSVSLIVTKSNDGLSVTVLPKVKEGADSAMSTPLGLKGTAEELDAEFTKLLAGYSGARKSLGEQAAETSELLKAAREASAKKGQDALKKSAKPASTTAPKTPAAQGCSVGCEDDNDDELTGDTPAAPAETTSTPSLFSD